MRQYLDVPPDMSSRRRSEGCLAEAFQSNRLVACKCKDCAEGCCMKPEHVPVLTKSASRPNFSNGVESNLLDVPRKNYDIASTLADIETPESGHPLGVANNQMRGPAPPRIFTSSPKPLVVRQHPYSKCNFEYENTSIASSDSSSDAEAPESILCRLSNEVKWFLYDIAEAFDGEPNDERAKPVKSDQQKLSAASLRRDLKRCYTFLHPLIEVAAAIYDTLLWKNPMHTLLLALVYTYSIVRGWTASLVLLLLWTQLSLNYLKATKNVDIGLYFLPRKEVAMPKFDINGAQLIFDVAKVAQQLLNFAANFLEKLHSLLMWKDRHVTLVFYCLVIYWLTLSMIFNTGTCLGMCGLTLGVRIFITTYLFDRFPRLRKRLDTYGWFYRNLPVRGSREGSPQLTVNTDLLPTIPSKTASPIPQRPPSYAGVFTSRLGSNFNLDTLGSQQNLSSPRHSFSVQPAPHKGSAQNLHRGSFDALSEKASAITQFRLANGQADPLTADQPMNVFRPNRAASISPLAASDQSSQSAHSPEHLAREPLLETPSESLDEEDETTTDAADAADNTNTAKSSSPSVCTDYEDNEAHEDSMIDNVLAYRSCVMHDKERTFPKGISSGILYLTHNALIYRTKSTDNHMPIIMLFTDVVSVKKTQSLRTMGLLTGTRKSLEIFVEGRRKPLQFIGVAQRDDFYCRIQAACESDANIRFL